MNRWNWELVVFATLHLIGWAVVYTTEIPNDIGLMLSCLWMGHFVTASIWLRRVKRIKEG